MEKISNIGQLESRKRVSFNLDTTFILFFLAVDLGQNLGVIRFDTVFLAVTLIVFAVIPFFTAPPENKQFGNWFLGRSLIIGFALMLGLMFKQTLGIVLPESFRFLPLTFLILTAMVSCYLQFYTFFKPRLSK